MRFIIAFISLLAFYSCSGNERIKKYNEIINSCDRIKVFSQYNGNIELIKDVAKNEELLALKITLKLEIKPKEKDDELILLKRFEIIKNNGIIGQLFVYKSFINFVSNDFELGFQPTYGIGMYPN